MKPWMKWSVALLALALLSAGVARVVVQKRQQVAAAGKPASAPPALELGSADVIAAQELELSRTLQISGGLKAANSALVKAKVAFEVKALSVREGDAVKAGQVVGRLDTT